jgi:predicted  nucleic acid-binding Zn-ribbon protein
MAMGQQIDQFCENLRQKLTIADSGLDGLKAKIDANTAHAAQDVQSHLQRVQNRIEQGRSKVSAAQADIRNWADQRKAATKENMAEWKAKHDLAKLNGRADGAERYAAASIDVAVAAIDEAEQASLEAWLARTDADDAQRK